MSRAAVALVCSVTLSMGCIITREPNYQDTPNFPPSVEDSPTADYPMRRVIEWPPNAMGSDAGVGGGALRLDAIIREHNIDEDVSWRVFFDYDDGRDAADQEPFRSDTLPPEIDTPHERHLEFVVPSSFIDDRPGCHRVELLVSKAFVGETRAPVTTGDLGLGVWWIVVGDGVDLATCP